MARRIKRYSRMQNYKSNIPVKRTTRNVIKNRKVQKRVIRKPRITQVQNENSFPKVTPNNRKDLENKLLNLRKRYEKTTKEFKEKNLSSYAQIALENSLQDREREIDTLSYNNILLEIAAYESFFDSESSTIEGIERINKEQDARIFGTDKKGELNYSMSFDERTEFWSLYDEFKRQNPLYATAMDSGRIQQILADLYLSGTYSNDINSLFENAKSKLMQEQNDENMGDIPNVFSGRGNYPY